MNKRHGLLTSFFQEQVELHQATPYWWVAAQTPCQQDLLEQELAVLPGRGDSGRRQTWQKSFKLLLLFGLMFDAQLLSKEMNCPFLKNGWKTNMDMCQNFGSQIDTNWYWNEIDSKNEILLVANICGISYAGVPNMKSSTGMKFLFNF